MYGTMRVLFIFFLFTYISYFFRFVRFYAPSLRKRIGFFHTFVKKCMRNILAGILSGKKLASLLEETLRSCSHGSVPDTL